MGTELTIHYDVEGVILMIDKCPPYPGQEAGPVGDLVVGRMNGSTGEIENLEILLFDRRLEREGAIRLPIESDFRAMGHRENGPTTPRIELTLRYDLTGDALTLEQRPPHSGQYKREICEDVSARLNARTGEIENLEIRRFRARMEKDGAVVLPINATLRPVKQAVSAE